LVAPQIINFVLASLTMLFKSSTQTLRFFKTYHDNIINTRIKKVKAMSEKASKPLVRMTVLDDFLGDIFKALIVKVFVDVLYEYAKKGLKGIKPFLHKIRRDSLILMVIFANKLKLISDSQSFGLLFAFALS
jgi:hypothetical protein